MRIDVKTQKRKSIAYYLAPEELTIVLPESGVPISIFERLRLTIANAMLDNSFGSSISKEQLKEISNALVQKLGVKPNRVQIRMLRKNWAMCSPSRNIVFNEALQKMPREFVEYVICHELLHLKIRRHNKLFRSLLSAYMPDWQERLTRTVEGFLGQKIETVFK